MFGKKKAKGKKEIEQAEKLVKELAGDSNLKAKKKTSAKNVKTPRKSVSNKSGSKKAPKRPVQKKTKKPAAKAIKPESKNKKQKKGKKEVLHPKPPEMRHINHDIFLETNVDKLLKLVQDRKKVRVKVASKELGVPRERIESWGNILEEHGMVEMHYPVFGDTIIRMKAKKAGEEENGE